MFFDVFSFFYYVLLRCPFCSIEKIPGSKYMASWPLHVLVVAHGYHVEYVDEAGDIG